MDPDQIVVVDRPERHRFLHEQDGLEAQLVYRSDGDRLVLVHTEVPEPLGGRGIGGRLVQAAVARAAASGETIAPWCPYARKWLRDHTDAVADVQVDWAPPPGHH